MSVSWPAPAGLKGENMAGINPYAALADAIRKLVEWVSAADVETCSRRTLGGVRVPTLEYDFPSDPRAKQEYDRILQKYNHILQLHAEVEKWLGVTGLPLPPNSHIETYLAPLQRKVGLSEMPMGRAFSTTPKRIEYVYVDPGWVQALLTVRQVAEFKAAQSRPDQAGTGRTEGGGAGRDQDEAGQTDGTSAPLSPNANEPLNPTPDSRSLMPMTRPPNETTEQPIIDALFKMKAVGLDGLRSIPKDKRPTGEKLAAIAIGRSCDGQFKQTLAHMVDLLWLGNGRDHGLGGGYFLTDAGVALVTPGKENPAPQ
jgi:hypothetical protein